MDKEARHENIKGFIRGKRVGTQQELAAHLARAGLQATQSSVSRDLDELGVVKQNGRYVLPRATGRAVRGLLSLEPAGDCLVVAKCEPGLASAVAVEIDRSDAAEIVGTLAGEDTIFVAVRERKAQRAAMKKIWGPFS